jgi:excisionase family DNA binding protein
MKKLFLNDDVASVESLTVNVRTAAKMLNVCERTIQNLTKRGELPVVKIAGCVRYSREVLIDFVRQGSRRESTDCTPS